MSDSPGQRTVAEMADECGYKENPEEDEDDGGVDALIEYKNTLEGRLIGMIDLRAELVELASEDLRLAYCVDPLERVQARLDRIAEVARGSGQ